MKSFAFSCRKILFFTIVILSALISTLSFAGADLDLAKQWEERGNFSKAGYHYDQAAQQEVNLDKRAKLHQRSLKSYLKTDDFNSIEESANRVRQYAKDGGASLIKELAPNYLEAGKRQAKNYNNSKAYELLSFYLSYHPGERNKLADDFYAKGNKDLAYQLNANLKTFDCKDMMGKADRAVKDDEMFLLYSNLISFCPVGVISFNDQQRIGRRVLDLAKRDARNPQRDAQTKEEKRIAGLFLGDNTVEAELPEKKVFSEGTYEFNLEPGEQSEYVIAFQSYILWRWDLSSLPDDHFEIVYSDGQIEPGWGTGSWPANKYNFKLYVRPEFKRQKITLKLWKAK